MRPREKDGTLKTSIFESQHPLSEGSLHPFRLSGLKTTRKGRNWEADKRNKMSTPYRWFPSKTVCLSKHSS